MAVTIYHNPACETSQNTLAMIRASDVEPAVIEHVKNSPSCERLVELITAMVSNIRALIREKGSPYAELGLENANLADDALIGAMLRYPILINRPIVVTNKRVRLCRPSELVLDILESPDIAIFTKEDGEVVNVATKVC